MKTYNIILKQTGSIFAKEGFEGVSISKIAKNSHIAKSVIYHYFKDKNILIKTMFDRINTRLGIERAKIIPPESASERLNQIIEFQFIHAEEIIAVLKYYSSFRTNFHKTDQGGYVPEKAYLHIEEILRYGVETGEFKIENLTRDSKIITHTINGFILEYYPDIPKDTELKQLVSDISYFILRAIITNSNKGKGVN